MSKQTNHMKIKLDAIKKYSLLVLNSHKIVENNNFDIIVTCFLFLYVMYIH